METIVLYPAPGIGHLISMVELGKLLITQNPSSSISIIIPTLPFTSASKTSPYISSVSSSFPSITFHYLPSVPLLLGDPSKYSDIEHIAFECLTNNTHHIHDFLQSTIETSPFSSFILDMFCYPALEIAQSFQIPTSFFYTSCANSLTFSLNFPTFDDIASDSFGKLGNTLFPIPGLFSVPASHMLEPMLVRGISYYKFIEMGVQLTKSHSIIINTFESLEFRAVQGLRDGSVLKGSRIPPIYCIGPLIATRGNGDKEEKEGRNECLSWLDLQPLESVVYLGFGSRGLFSKEQIKEIAIGLEKSGVRFLWVVRSPPNVDKDKRFNPPSEPDLDSLLPVGFLDRTKDRGLVVKSWVPQIAILGHESIGGFVTHCGWNSILEAVAAGVPMVAWPLYAEQRFNKIVLVDEIKVALPMNETEDRFVGSDEIEKRVKQIVNSEEGDVLRKRVLELSHEAKAALSEEGSSKRELVELIESWKR